jgi:transcriptional regulator with XRE-family HTH domain
MNAIHYNIRQIRLIRNFTQEYVASEIRVSTEWYNKMENGKAKINTDQLERLAKVLQVNPENFYTFTSSKVLDHLDQKGLTLGNDLQPIADRDLIEKLVLALQNLLKK